MRGDLELRSGGPLSLLLFLLHISFCLLIVLHLHLHLYLRLHSEEEREGGGGWVDPESPRSREPTRVWVQNRLEAFTDQEKNGSRVEQGCIRNSDNLTDFKLHFYCPLLACLGAVGAQHSAIVKSGSGPSDAAAGTRVGAAMSCKTWSMTAGHLWHSALISQRIVTLF